LYPPKTTIPNTSLPSRSRFPPNNVPFSRLRCTHRA
jgi:hypothetical protein